MAAAAIRRGMLASAVVVVAVLALGSLWLACALRIASAVDRCVAVKAAGFPVWGRRRVPRLDQDHGPPRRPLADPDGLRRAPRGQGRGGGGQRPDPRGIT
uniref:Uncharacterized protein n=1 Tax=Oryza punctata TaxID=4537 RepID=A0A0E0LUW0_ORYPU